MITLILNRTRQLERRRFFSSFSSIQRVSGPRDSVPLSDSSQYRPLADENSRFLTGSVCMCPCGPLLFEYPGAGLSIGKGITGWIGLKARR